MARNSGGTYSLPAGNPVVSGTTISSTTHNSTQSDIASELTDSLSRSGKGAMLAPLELADGSANLPGLSFDTDPDCGLYRIGANNLGIAIASAKVVDISAAGVAVTGAASATTTLTAGTALVAGTTLTAGTNIIATAGDVSIANDKDFKYATAATRYFHLGAEAFQTLTSTSVPVFISSSWLLAWGSLTGSTHSQTGSFRLPPGATVTAVEIYLHNTSGGSISVVTPSLTLRTYNAGVDAGTTMDGGGTIAVADAFNGYKTASLGAGPYAIPDSGDGCIQMGVTLNQTAGGANQLKFYGARITYTLTKLRA